MTAELTLAHLINGLLILTSAGALGAQCLLRRRSRPARRAAALLALLPFLPAVSLTDDLLYCQVFSAHFGGGEGTAPTYRGKVDRISSLEVLTLLEALAFSSNGSPTATPLEACARTLTRAAAEPFTPRHEHSRAPRAPPLPR